MKSALWILLLLTGLTGVVISLAYLYAASKLPSLESEFDIERLLRHSVESERMSFWAGKLEKPPRPITFTRPDFLKLPKDLVTLYVTQLGCPAYFQTPREGGAAWAWRLLVGVTVDGLLPGNGGCEHILALRIAHKLGGWESLELTVAAHKVHSLLQKDQLIAYDLAILWFEQGVVGVEEAAHALFGRELDKLQLSELAELQLALPPYGLYKQMKDCQNGALIRQRRDLLLQELESLQLVPQEKARGAMAQPVACTLR